MQQELIYIYTIYEERSFSKAAQRLHVTQPALSAAVKRVESSIGAAVFDRSSHPLSLTEAGQIYLAQIRQIMELERDTATQINDLFRLRRGSVRIGATNYFNSYVLPPALCRFANLYPQVDLQLLEENSAMLDGSLLSGTTDLIFHCREETSPLCAYTEVFQDFLLLAVPPSFPCGDGLEACALTAGMVSDRRHLDPALPCAPLNCFSDVPFVLLTEGNNLYERACALFTQAGFQPRVKMSVEQFATAYHLSCAGLGATFTSARLIQNSPARDMRYYKLNSPLAVRHFCAVTRRGRYVPQAVQELIRVIQELYLP